MALVDFRSDANLRVPAGSNRGHAFVSETDNTAKINFPDNVQIYIPARRLHFTLRRPYENLAIVLPASNQVTTCSRAVTRTPAVRSPNSENQAEIVIIGAGPAGLSLAFELQRRGLPCLILEKGSSVGESWKKMPRDMKLLSPWKCNRLPGTPNKRFGRHYEISRAEFLEYLNEYAESAALPVRAETAVYSVEKGPHDNRFRIETSRGVFCSRVVVNAAGYFSNPFVPQIAGGSESAIPQRHVADYREPQDVSLIIGKSTGLVLIVGKRLSAGQIMVELAGAGFTVALAHRTPIRYGSGPFAWWFLFRMFPWLELLKLKLKGTQAPSNDVPMPGGLPRRLIARGQVQTFPQIERFERDEVLFADGRRLKPDLVLYATGFRPALEHLSSLELAICKQSGRLELQDLESTSVPGLYFLGLDHGRNFRSRFIRGIREDAAFLAERLSRSFGRPPPDQRPVALA